MPKDFKLMPFPCDKTQGCNFCMYTHIYSFEYQQHDGLCKFNLRSHQRSVEDKFTSHIYKNPQGCNYLHVQYMHNITSYQTQRQPGLYKFYLKSLKLKNINLRLHFNDKTKTLTTLSRKCQIPLIMGNAKHTRETHQLKPARRAGIQLVYIYIYIYIYKCQKGHYNIIKQIPWSLSIYKQIFKNATIS